VVALIHDSSGEVVRKVSRELERKESAAEMAQPENERILYAEAVALAPGHYIIDTAVTDEESGKTSAKRVSVFVDPRKDLSLSSLGLVRRFDPSNEPRQGPFEMGTGHVTPMLVDSIPAQKPVSLYFVIYPTKAENGEVPKVTLEMLKDGRAIARKPLSLAQPEADGSIPMMVELAPGPGQCDVLVTAKQGTAVAQSSLSVRIE
jgi:hypothetical protein